MCILNGRNYIRLILVLFRFSRCLQLTPGGRSHQRVHVVNNASNIPDHSLIKCTIGVDSCVDTSSENIDNFCSSFDKFDVSNVPSSFLADQNTTYKVNEAIIPLESGLHTQSDVDTVYSDWCELVQTQMYSNLPYRTFSSRNDNKKVESLVK